MLAISLQQPYASAVVLGIKGIENRTWPTKVRGRVLIHAGKSTRRLAERDEFPELDGQELPLGSIIGSVEIVDCLPVEQAPQNRDTHGPWCFVLANPVAFDQPIPHTGKLMFFEVTLPKSSS